MTSLIQTPPLRTDEMTLSVTVSLRVNKYSANGESLL